MLFFAMENIEIEDLRKLVERFGRASSVPSTAELAQREQLTDRLSDLLWSKFRDWGPGDDPVVVTYSCDGWCSFVRN